MKAFNVFYVSFGGTTQRFVENKLRPCIMASRGDKILNEVRLTPPTIHSSEGGYETHSYLWDHTHGGIFSISRGAPEPFTIYRALELAENKEAINVVVAPTYGSYNPASGKTENYTPKMLLELTRELERRGTPFRLGVAGNRTFGADYGAAAKEIQGQERTQIFELDGSFFDAQILIS